MIDKELQEDIIYNHLDELAIYLAGIVADMAVDHVINKIRPEEPCLIYTQQERL